MVTPAVRGLYLTLGLIGEMSKGWMDVVKEKREKGSARRPADEGR